MAIRHVIRTTHAEGVKLANPSSWCGRDLNINEWAFLDAQHVADSAGGSIAPCKKCIKAIIKQLETEL